MKFSRISVTKKGVNLAYEKADEHKSEETVAKSSEQPLSTFVDALQSFTPFVIDLLEIPEEWRANLTVTTLNLSEDKNGYRGLIVTATRPVPKAYDRPLVLNTPLVREGSDEASDEACTLPDEVLELIGLVETEAVRYLNGEREQRELFNKSESSENVKDFDQRAAAAEVASTRKPKRNKKGKDFIPGVGDVANPEATEPPTSEQLRALLLKVGRDMPIDALSTLTSSERDAILAWAVAKEDPFTPERDMPLEPEAVKAFATLPLSDGWTTDRAPALDDNAVQQIHASVEHGD